MMQLKEIEEEIRVADEESWCCKAVDKIRRHWYICCTDGFIAEHKGVIYNGSLCKTTECDVVMTNKVHLFTSIGDEVVEYEPP